MKIIGKVWKGNRNGVGFVKLPIEVIDNFNLKDRIKVNALRGSINFETFYSSISSYKGYLGFYIPKNICLSHNIIGQELIFDINKVDGFYSKLGNDGRLYLPSKLSEELRLKQNDLILIEGHFGNLRKTKLCKLKVREKNGRKEYFCIFSSESKNRSGLFNIKRKLSKEVKEPLKSILKGLDFGVWGKNKISIIQHKSQLDITPNIELNENLFFYFGCYFADGTKRNNWAITASTFEQANFYKRMHESLILNPEYDSSYISITLKKKVNLELIKNLWEKNCKIKVNRVRKRFSRNGSSKIHTYGSLVIRDSRVITLTYYKRLLEYVINYIISGKDQTAALNFICGVLEGDGSPSARKRGYIIISSNKDDIPILDKILKIAGLGYKINTNRSKTFVRVNTLSLISKLESISSRIFIYYPERRKKFIERFCRVGAVKFILGQQSYCSSWVKAWLKKEGILNKEYQLTPKGLKIK
ncbi:MAG: hypothetical protein QXQ77_01180, partial [Candidatus Aenigmatarchaeota archaeon]